MSLPNLTVVDDEADLAELVCDIAEEAGFNACKYSDAELFKREFSHSADVIVLDLMMPGVDGIEVIRFLAERQCSALLVLMSGFDVGVLHSAQQLAAEQGLNLVKSINKPFRPDELEQLLRELPVADISNSQHREVFVPTITELRKALHNDELTVYFQPKVSISADHYYAVEALARWIHPEKGMMSPALFIPLAEENQLIDELTWVIFRKAMECCHGWHLRGVEIKVALNMSALTLRDLELPEKMAKLAQEYGITPSQIVLEITESSLMLELIKSLDILTRFRIKGFSLSIDDFGTGYSSLLHLYRAPFSEMKIDQSFVTNMANDTEAHTIVETIISLAHNLKMYTVAEGVETEECYQLLCKLGCDQVQGYLLAKPMPEKELIDWFSKKISR